MTLYLLMDLVVNHCSSEHEWFQKAMADPEGEYGQYFISKMVTMDSRQRTGDPILEEVSGRGFRGMTISFICIPSQKNSQT